MARRSDITADAAWFWGEAKQIVITVLDDADAAVNLSAKTLQWRVLKEQGSSQIYLQRGTGGSGITVGGPSSNIVAISVTETDYTALAAGIHYHELWNVTDRKVESYGDAFVHKTRGPA